MLQSLLAYAIELLAHVGELQCPRTLSAVWLHGVLWEWPKYGMHNTGCVPVSVALPLLCCVLDSRPLPGLHVCPQNCLSPVA